MTRIADLIPGQQITVLGLDDEPVATFVARTQHPIWPSLQLVVWRLDDGTWSHDALDHRQDVGEPAPSTAEQRLANLRAALLGQP